jgi:DNA polymerase III delta prime subunit
MSWKQLCRSLVLSIRRQLNLAGYSLLALGAWAVVVAWPALAQSSSGQAKPTYEWLSDPQHWGPIGAAIVGIAALITQLDKVVDLFKKYRAKEPTVTAEDLQTLRTKLLKHLNSDFTMRIETSLNHLVKLDLQMEDQRHRVGQPLVPLVSEDPQPVNLLKRVFKVFQAPKSTPTELRPSQRILEMFKQSDIDGKLLILGEPGSGKTTELLTLAQDLLAQAEANAALPLPIIFELSAWDGQPFEDWLVQQLLEKYQPRPKVIAKAMVDQECMLPLLDGLDELGLEQQRKCIAAINQFMQQRPLLKLAVCCRREEYEQGKAELYQLKGAVYLKPLTPTEIEQSLRGWNRSSLWDNIKQQPELLGLAKTPLFLSMLVVSYQELPIRNTNELMSAYIQTKLHDPKSQGTYPPRKEPAPEKTLNYLCWLAQKLDAEKQTEFLIEMLQPTWLDSNRLRLQYRWIYGLIFGLFGLIFGLSVGLSVGLLVLMRFGPFGGLIVGLIYGLMGGLMSGLSVGLMGGPFGALVIKTTEKLNFSWSKFLRSGLIYGLMGGLMSGLSVGLIFGLMGGLIYGLMGGLIGGLIFGLSASEVNIKEKARPNEGITRSVQNYLFVGLIFGLIFGLSVGLMGGLIYGLMGGLIFGLRYWLKPVLQHVSLRLVLYRSGSSPWNYARFLDHAAKHRFIQRVGGRYRFMHDLLRKHFAALTHEDIKQLAQKPQPAPHP